MFCNTRCKRHQNVFIRILITNIVSKRLLKICFPRVSIENINLSYSKKMFNRFFNVFGDGVLRTSSTGSDTCWFQTEYYGNVCTRLPMISQLISSLHVEKISTWYEQIDLKTQWQRFKFVMKSGLSQAFSCHVCWDYGQLVPKTTRTQDNSNPGQLVPRTTRTQDNSLSWVRVVQIPFA